MRTLIFILSYNAERTIERVLMDLPSEYRNNPAVHILVIDDASSDRTVEVARECASKAEIGNVQVLANRINQGYGGNQKIGYRYAIKEGFDAVAMLHGDAQYTPVVLPQLLQPLEKHPTTDCVLGVRFGSLYSPLKGGMPLYKYVGNRILTWVQNGLAESQLREWHTGYRVYRVQALAKIAFELNTNDFHFDTEILLQLMDHKCKIEQINIPTHYADEICHVNGLRYAKDVLKATVKYRLQRYNLFYDVRYHPMIALTEQLQLEQHRLYDHKWDSCSPHSLVCTREDLVPSGSAVLDIGCSHGYVSRNLANAKKCSVTGIDILAASMVEKTGFDYVQINLEEEHSRLNALLEKSRYDVVLVLDVLEHLSIPEAFLLNLYRRRYKTVPRFIFSTGNIAFFVVRLMLLFGFFNYGNKGILDVTHRRLFSNRTFKNALEQTGFIILEKIYIPFPFRALGISRGLSMMLERINTFTIKLWPSLFAYQIMVVAVPLTPPDFTLADTLRKSGAQDAFAHKS